MTFSRFNDVNKWDQKKKIFYLCIYVSIESNQLHIYFKKKECHKKCRSKSKHNHLFSFIEWTYRSICHTMSHSNYYSFSSKIRLTIARFSKLWRHIMKRWCTTNIIIFKIFRFWCKNLGYTNVNISHNHTKHKKL